MGDTIDIKIQIEALKAQVTIAKLNAELNKASKSVEQNATKSKILTQQLKNLEGAAKNGAKGFTIAGAALSSFLGNLASNVVTSGFNLLTSGFKSFISAGVDGAKQMEDIRTQLQVLTGSTDEANRALADLTKFAAETPFELPQLAKAQSQLISFGFNADKSASLLKNIGDVSAAANTPIAELALIFGQVSAAGKLTGERLLQFQERAIPIGPALAETLGVAESQIRKLVSEGKVSFADFEKAFTSLNETGNFAFDGLAKRSRTLSGRISTLKDSFNLFAASVVESSGLSVGLKALTTTLTSFIEKIQNSAQFKGFLETIGNGIPAAISFALDSFSFIINSVLNVIKIFNLFRSGVTTALNVVFSAFTIFIKGYAKVINALGLGDTAVGRAVNGFNDFRTGVIDALDKTGDQFAQSAADISISQEKINNSIQTSKNFILDAYDKEAKAAQDQAKIVGDANNQKNNSRKTVTETELAAIAKEEAARKKLAESVAALRLAELQSKLEEQGNDNIFREQRLIAIQDAFTAEQEAAIQAKLDLAENATEREVIITDALKQGIENRKKLKQDELDLIRSYEQDYTEFQKKEQTERLQNQQRTLNLFSTLANSKSKELAAIGKAAGIAQIAVDTPVAVASAFKFGTGIGGPAVGAVFGGIAAAAMAAQAAQIAGVGFEQGGIVGGTSFTGDRVAARVNSGEMILNRQQQAALFSMANGGGGSSGQQEIVVHTTIELDGEAVGRTVSRQVANGLKLGEVQ